MFAAPRILNAPATCMFSHLSSTAVAPGLDEPCTSGVRRTMPRMRAAADRISARVTSGSEASAFMDGVCIARRPSAVDARGNQTFMDLTDRLVVELIESVKQVLKREASERLREVYL